jgi:hypothetical protein
MTAIEKKEYHKQWYLKNKEIQKQKYQQYYLKNKEILKEKVIKYNLDNINKVKENKKKYYLKNKDFFLIKQKIYLENNIDLVKKYHKQWRLVNKEKIIQKNKIFRINNKEKISNYRKEYYLKNKEKISLNSKIYNKKNQNKKNEYYRNKKLIDPLFKLSCKLRTSIGGSFRKNGYTKKSKTYQILGCSFEDFKIHLEKQFTEGMSWENQGKWHLDHIYPVSKAKDEDHLIKLNHYTNFQPLWAIDNIKKGNKILC